MEFEFSDYDSTQSSEDNIYDVLCDIRRVLVYIVQKLDSVEDGVDELNGYSHD